MVRIIDLYIKQSDEEFIPFSDQEKENGFSIIKSYKNQKLKEYKMMMKFFLDEQGNLLGSVGAVRERKTQNGLKEYLMTDANELSIPLNNFFFNGKDFIYKENVFFHKNIKLNLNEVVKNVEFNHLNKRMKVLQDIKCWFHTQKLKVLFWLGDNSYKYDDLLKSYVTTDSYKKVIKKNLDRKEPLFNYFMIWRNILGLFILLVGIYLVFNCKLAITDITKLYVIIYGFLCLFFLEIISNIILNVFNDIDNQNGYIQKLVNKSQGTGFSLKIEYKGEVK